MATFDYEYVIKNLPPQIERVEDVHLRKLFECAAATEECAKALGVPNLIKVANDWTKAVNDNADYIRRMCGQEGDKATDAGSFQGVVTAAKSMKKSLGGDE